MICGPKRFIIRDNCGRERLLSLRSTAKKARMRHSVADKSGLRRYQRVMFHAMAQV